MNIEIHGFETPLTIQEQIWSRLISQLTPQKSAECCVSIVNSKPQGRDGRIAPFIRVYSNNRNDFGVALRLLKDVTLPGSGLKTPVECILLTEYFEI